MHFFRLAPARKCLSFDSLLLAGDKNGEGLYIESFLHWLEVVIPPAARAEGQGMFQILKIASRFCCRPKHPVLNSRGVAAWTFLTTSAILITIVQLEMPVAAGYLSVIKSAPPGALSGISAAPCSEAEMETSSRCLLKSA